jgi:hypothetical protein
LILELFLRENPSGGLPDRHPEDILGVLWTIQVIPESVHAAKQYSYFIGAGGTHVKEYSKKKISP